MLSCGDLSGFAEMGKVGIWWTMKERLGRQTTRLDVLGTVNGHDGNGILFGISREGFGYFWWVCYVLFWVRATVAVLVCMPRSCSRIQSMSLRIFAICWSA